MKKQIDRKNIFFTVITLAITLMAIVPSSAVEVRIKDITHIPEVASNQLWGMGVVVGLPGSGDSTRLLLGRKALANMLTRMEGLRIDSAQFQPRNIATVMATAELPPFSKVGDRIDVTISSIGDAKALDGGTMLFARLQGSDGEVYVTAQGLVTSPQPKAGARGDAPPMGKISSGGLVVRKIESNLAQLDSISLRLKNPDSSTASMIAKKINETFWNGIAEPIDFSTVKVAVPEAYKGKLVNFVSTIGTLTVSPDVKATVVVNQKSGAVVIGEGVRISTFAVSLNSGDGMLSVKINKMPSGEASLEDVISALQSVGSTTDDLIEVLKLMEKAGALHATLIIM